MNILILTKFGDNVVQSVAQFFLCFILLPPLTFLEEIVERRPGSPSISMTITVSLYSRQKKSIGLWGHLLLGQLAAHFVAI